MTRRWFIAGAVALLALAAVGGALLARRAKDRSHLVVVEDQAAERGGAPEGAPSVVVVIGCTLRRDQLQLYRPDLDSTPWLASLAERGVVFDDMLSAAPWTRPASVAILTGRHAASVGMVEPGGGLNNRVLADEVLTMPEWFRSHGWRTVGGTANPNLSSTWGMSQGFDRYVEPSGLWSEGTPVKHTGAEVGDRVLAQLDGADDRPLYLQVMFIDAHAPFPEAAEGWEKDRSVPAQVHRYRSGVRDFDAAVRRLHIGLLERGYTPENTIFVVLNDHGEGLLHPVHHGKGHGRYLAPSTLGGVWWMAGPGVPEGKRIPGMASQVDVFPTLAELAGVPLGPAPVGTSHVRAFEWGRTARSAAYADTWFHRTSRAAVYTEGMACQDDFARVGASRGDSSFRPGCFDRLEDPEHRIPIENAEMQADLRAWRAALEAEMTAFTGTSSAVPDPGTKAQLEALGYVEDEPTD